MTTRLLGWMMALAAGLVTQGCEPKIAKRSARGGSPAGEPPVVALALPELTAFELSSEGDVQALLASYWYTLAAEDEGCDAEAREANADFVGGDFIEVEVKADCGYSLTLALGKNKKAYYKTSKPVAVIGGDPDLFVRLERTPAGEAAGFRTPWVEADRRTGADDTGDDDGDEPGVVSYLEIKDLLDDHCIACHAKAGSRPNSDLTTFAGAKAFSELLVDYVVGGRMPPLPAKLTDDAKRLVKQWGTDGFRESPDSVNPDDNESDDGGQDPGVVEFSIASGTGSGAWNTPATRVNVKVGQTLRVVNRDSVVHQLHTNGAPCPHGEPIAPGQSWDCRISQPYTGSNLYDHGTDGAFFIRAEP